MIAIVVRDGLVEFVTAGPADVEVAEGIDARGQVAMPGFINCHTHLLDRSHGERIQDYTT